MSSDDELLADDDARARRQHEQAKELVRAEVNREVRVETVQQTPSDANQAALVAKKMKDQAFREVATSDAALTRARRLQKATQLIDYGFYLLYSAIVVVVVLELVGANSGSRFMRFMSAVTGPFLAPFTGLMPHPHVDRFQLMASYVVALVIYALVHRAVTGALQLFAGRATANTHL